jgi:hypothetical protein
MSRRKDGQGVDELTGVVEGADMAAKLHALPQTSKA